MKTVRVGRDFPYHAGKHTTVRYKAGETYQRVPEAHAEAIVSAGAGSIVVGEGEETNETQEQPRRARKR